MSRAEQHPLRARSGSGSGPLPATVLPAPSGGPVRRRGRVCEAGGGERGRLPRSLDGAPGQDRLDDRDQGLGDRAGAAPPRRRPADAGLRLHDRARVDLRLPRGRAVRAHPGGGQRPGRAAGRASSPTASRSRSGRSSPGCSTTTCAARSSRSSGRPTPSCSPPPPPGTRARSTASSSWPGRTGTAGCRGSRASSTGCSSRSRWWARCPGSDRASEAGRPRRAGSVSRRPGPCRRPGGRCRPGCRGTVSCRS